MFRKKLLKTSADFDNAIYFNTLVTVWQNGFILDLSGVIEEHTEEYVIIKGYKLSKELFEFRVR